MAVLIDVIGSLIFAGLIILAINTGTADLNEATYEHTYSLNVQTNSTSLARMVEYDFVKIGYRSPSPAILSMDSTGITFTSDLLNNGVVKTVQYSIGSPTDSNVAGTRNPRDFLLFRSVTGENTLRLSSGLVDFKLTYYDSSGAMTATASEVKSIRVQMKLESIEPVDTDTLYPGVFWEKTIYPRNL